MSSPTFPSQRFINHHSSFRAESSERGIPLRSIQERSFATLRMTCRFGVAGFGAVEIVGAPTKSSADGPVGFCRARLLLALRTGEGRRAVPPSDVAVSDKTNGRPGKAVPTRTLRADIIASHRKSLTTEAVSYKVAA
jgi:hypothetical protein